MKINRISERTALLASTYTSNRNGKRKPSNIKHVTLFRFFLMENKLLSVNTEITDDKKKTADVPYLGPRFCFIVGRTAFN